MTRPTHDTPRRHGRGDAVWDNVKQFFIAIVLALVIKTSVVEAYKIPTSSMEDTLLVGDFLLANKFVYGARVPMVNWRMPAISDPQRGDVVIFIWPGDMTTKYIKRCVGLPGDTILVKDKVLLVNGQPFPNPEFSKFTSREVEPRKPGGQNSRDNFGPFVVPRDNYFMMGDNRDNSSDSRFWGTVHKDLVLGEAMMVHWSWDDSEYPSPPVTLSDPLSVPRVFLFNVGHFFDKVRWSRLFSVIN
ncbi:MAG: signal peptidase I [bacterium]|nr:signal peptidase I [bacterium]